MSDSVLIRFAGARSESRAADCDTAASAEDGKDAARFPFHEQQRLPRYKGERPAGGTSPMFSPARADLGPIRRRTDGRDTCADHVVFRSSQRRFPANYVKVAKREKSRPDLPHLPFTRCDGIPYFSFRLFSLLPKIVKYLL